MDSVEPNSIIQGDCLDWLDRVKPNSVDLCYIDPPFFTQRDFHNFTDKWNGRDSYLGWIRRRIVKIKKVLKPDGFFVLHCDQKADYKLRIVLEDIFGENNYRGQVIWKRRASAFMLAQDKEFQKIVSSIHDSLFFFSRSDTKKLNKQYISQEGMKTSSHYKRMDPTSGKRYGLQLACKRGEYSVPNGSYAFMGISPKDGYRWVLSEKTMLERYNKGLVVLDKDKNQIYLKQYEPKRGLGVGSVWIDVPPNYSGAQIYSTQKPERLLKRIIKMCTSRRRPSPRLFRRFRYDRRSR